MKRKKNMAAYMMAMALSTPLVLTQPLAVLAESTVQMETEETLVEGEKDKTDDNQERETVTGDEAGVATPGNAEYVEPEKSEQEENRTEETQKEEVQEEETQAEEVQEEETREEETQEDLKDQAPEEEQVASPSEARPATPSNAQMPALFSSGDIWAGYTMSAQLDGEGTEESPYLIKNENDLKYIVYHTAEGNVDGFSRCYFKLTTDITLSSGSSWIPIGYFWSEGDAAPEPFKGTFDGGGHKIKNLNISNSSQVYAGLFGQTMDAVIKDVTVSASVSAGNLSGGIVGEANETVISNCQVSGTVKAAGVAGGIVGEGYDVVINDCRNTAIVYASAPSSSSESETVAAGGIIGSVHGSRILNCSNESTESATSVYSEGSVGGIAGNVIASKIYNSYVSGKIGSINAQTIGGVVGRLESGEVKIARMEGVIGKSTSSGLKWAGLFVGYIVDNSTQLGPDKDLAYLYTDDEAVYALNPFGNALNGLIDKTHHIGAYTSTNTVSLYNPVATPKFSLLADTYFYEELEEGVLEVGDEDVYHWAPSRTGAPVRGYRITVPSIDHGTLSVIESQNPFAKELNWANSGAVAAGRKVLVYASPANETEGEVPVYYELVPDSLRWFEDGGDDYGLIRTDGTEVAFQMPQKNITLNAEYQAMTNGVVLDKTELHFQIEQIRSGSRWEPEVAWKITDPQKLVATVLPSSAANKELSWNVKDADGSYTDVIEMLQDGTVSVNKDARWITELISSAVSNQLNLYPSKPITLQATNYASATVTAKANGSRASSLVTVDLTVTDHTVVPVESVSLSESGISFEVERVLTGNRLKPEVDVKVSPSRRLYATVSPVYSSNREVSFTNGDGMTDVDMVTVSPDGLVTVNPEAKWIADLLLAESETHRQEPYKPYDLAASRATYVTATTTDGGKTAVCAVNVNVKTTDQTIVYPEGVRFDSDTLDFKVDVEKTGYWNNPTVTVRVSDPQMLKAQVYPKEAHNQGVDITSGQPEVVSVNEEGQVSVSGSSEWVTSLIAQNTAQASLEVPVTVKTEEGGYTDVCMVRIAFRLVDNTRSSSSGGSFGGGGGGGGGSSSGGPTRGSGAAAGGPAAGGTWEQQPGSQEWKFRRTDGTYAISQWEQAVYNGTTEWYYFDQNGVMMTGWYTDPNGDRYYLNPVSDGTRGRMVTGWNLIDGKWYYFNEISDGTRGALLRNTVTPDHYRVDQDGVWIPG